MLRQGPVRHRLVDLLHQMIQDPQPQEVVPRGLPAQELLGILHCGLVPVVLKPRDLRDATQQLHEGERDERR